MKESGDKRTLLVPISLEALVVSKQQESLSVVNMGPSFDRFSVRSVPKIGDSVRPKPWDPRQQSELRCGVHLHWALPAALTHGEQAKNGEMHFPRVPNRWLVLRIATDAKQTPEQRKRQTQAWVLQSDYIGEPNQLDDSGHVLLLDGGRYVPRQIGRVFRYEDARWREELNQSSVWPLTAVAPGNPGFAAFYPSCCNVFGYHDTLDDIGPGRFSYLVAGWYGEAKHDPLRGCIVRAEQGDDRARLFKQAWLDPRLKKDKSDGRICWVDAGGAKYEIPSRTLCHGVLQNVTWSESAETGREGNFDIAMGNTATEALSALLTQRLGRERMEPVLSAFQYDIVGKLEKLHGILELEDEMHRRRFYPTDGGGTQWVLRQLERSVDQQSRQGKREPSFPKDVKISTWFNKLCERQATYDQLLRERLALGERYYAMWFLRQLLETSGSLEPKPEELFQEKLWLQQLQDIAETESNIRIEEDEIEKLQNQVRDGIRQLAKVQHPGEAEPKLEYELITAPMPRFWRPSDPAILLGNVINSGKHRYGDAPKKPRCRVVESVLSSLTAGISVNTGTVDTDAAFPLVRTDPNMPFDAIAALYYESLLLDQELIEHFAEKACANDRFGGSWERVAEALGKQIDEKLEGLEGVAVWNSAWDPLYMVWKLEWRPSYSDLSQWNQENRWVLGGGSEYQPAPGFEPRPKEQGASYHGWAPLSLSIGSQFKERLLKLAASKRTATTDGASSSGSSLAVDVFKDWSFLSQSANGFTNMLLLRDETLQLPPVDNDGNLLEEVRKLMGLEPRWSPLVVDADLDHESHPKFSMLRAGHFRLADLSLVDVFGRSMQVLGKPSKISVTEALGGGTKDRSAWIPSPPRIAQPSRLRCSWVSVADERDHGQYRESNSNPATSPILGWVVPNYFDRSLVLCDRNAKVRGEIRIVVAGDETEVQFCELPGGVTSAQGRAYLDAKDCFQLGEFVAGLRAAGPAAFQACLAIMGRISLCITTPAARQLETMSLVLGQPLALVRASLQLEVWGHLAGDPPWVKATPASAVGAAKPTFPVRLGDIRRSNDGLIGYFLPDAAGRTDYTNLRLSYGVQLPHPSPRYLTSGVNAGVTLAQKPLTLTLLMDPRARVHFVSGILPIESLELPDCCAREALENMELSFRVGPVLAGKEGLRLPLPDDVTGVWSWHDRDPENGADWRSNTTVTKPTSGAAVPSERVEICDGWVSLNRAPLEGEQKKEIGG